MKKVLIVFEYSKGILILKKFVKKISNLIIVNLIIQVSNFFELLSFEFNFSKFKKINKFNLISHPVVFQILNEYNLFQ